MVPMLIGALASGTLSALSSTIQDGQKAEADRRQAYWIKQGIEDVKKSEERNEISKEEAVNRINEYMQNASAGLRSAMETQVNVAADEMTRAFQYAIDDQMRQLDKMRGQVSEQTEQKRRLVRQQLEEQRRSLQDTRKDIKSAFTQSRLGASGALLQAFGKMQSQQQTKERQIMQDEGNFENQIAKQLLSAESDFASSRARMTGQHEAGLKNLRLEAGSRIGQGLVGVQEWGAALKEQKIGQAEAQSEALKMQRSQMGLAAEQMEERGQYDAGRFFGNFGLGMLGAAAPALGAAVGQGVGGAMEWGEMAGQAKQMGYSEDELRGAMSAQKMSPYKTQMDLARVNPTRYSGGNQVNPNVYENTR